MSGHNGISQRFQNIEKVKKLMRDGMKRVDAVASIAPSLLSDDDLDKWITDFIYDNSDALRGN